MRWLTIFLLCFVAGCAAGSGGPFNAVSDGDDRVLMLKGHDPVGYFTVGKHMQGKPEIKTQYEGATYRFASEENKATFLVSPTKYIPQYGGFCANGIVYGIPWGGDPDTWKIINGKLTIFGGQSSMNYFLADESNNVKLADQYWASEIRGSNALIQRYRRLVLRVPHYKTGAQLEAEWALAQQRVSPADRAKSAEGAEGAAK